MNMFERLHENALKDNALLARHDELGDIFSVPRDVDFAFKTKNPENAKDLCEFINGKNFGSAKVWPTEGDSLIWVIVIIHMPVTQNVLCAVSGFMICLSQLFKVEFDGWGSVVESPETAPKST